MIEGLKSRTTLSDLRRGLWSMVGLCSVAVGLAWFAANQAQDQAGQLQQRIVPAIKTVLGVMTDLRDGRLLELQVVGTGNDAARAALEREMAVNRQAVEQRLNAYQELDALDGQHRQAVSLAALAHWAAQDQVLAAARRAAEGSASADVATQLSQGLSQQSYVTVSQALDAWRLHGDRVAQASQATGHAALLRGRWLGWGMALCLMAAVVVGVRTMWAQVRHVQQPLQQAVRALRSLIDGDLNYRVKIRRADEFGELLATIDDMREVVVPMALRDEGEEDAEPMLVRLVVSEPETAPHKAFSFAQGDAPAQRPSALPSGAALAA